MHLILGPYVLQMERLVVVLLLLWMFQANGDSFPFIDNHFLQIECGVTGSLPVTINNQSWFPDSFFINSGNTSQITDPSVPQFMTTLRYFPDQQHLYCFILPLLNTETYIFRAGFYYANYDGKSEQPVFDLLLEGQPWATVNSSAPTFHELIYWPEDGNVSVCLQQGSGTPFVSSLEATYLPHYSNVTLYSKMENGTAYHLLTRVSFGSDQVIQPWSSGCEEELNRYWMPQQMPGYLNVSFGSTQCAAKWYENRPPTSLLETAISPQDASQSIHVPITFPTTNPQTAYIVLYFYQNLDPDANPTRFMDVYMDGFIMANVKLQRVRSVDVVTLYPVMVRGVANLTISPANGTVLPPLLNGMEVFIARDLAEQPVSFGNRIKISSSLLLLHFFLALFDVLS